MPKFFEPSQTQEENFQPKIEEAGEIKTLLSWTAPARPFRKKDRSYYTTVAILVILLALIAILIQEFLLIGVLFALGFVTYVLAFVPPGDVDYKISTQGVTIGENFYFWHSLDSFWFKIREGMKVLFIQTKIRFPGQLMLVLDPSTSSGQGEEEIKKEIAKFLPFHEIPQTTLLERWADGLAKHFPLENTHK